MSPDDDPEGDRSSLQVLGADGKQTTVFAPPSPSSVRSLAVLADGRSLVATNALVEGQLDTRRLVLAAGPTLDRQSFDYVIGETYNGWISRRRTLLRRADGALRRVRWAGPPADALAPDGARDLLVAWGGRLWTTRAGLGAPEVGRLAERRVGVRLGSPATVTVTVRSDRGMVRTRTPPSRLPAGLTLVKLPRSPGAGTVRVTVATARAGETSTSSRWAFAGSKAFTPQQADRVLSAVARRLYVGFDEYAHGVDRCVARSRTVVTCRWTTGGAYTRFTKGGDAGPQTTRSVRLTRSPAGYELLAGEPRPGPRKGRNRKTLGPAVDAH